MDVLLESITRVPNCEYSEIYRRKWFQAQYMFPIIQISSDRLTELLPEHTNVPLWWEQMKTNI